MKTIYLMTRLAWKVFISSKPCRLIVILLQGFVQHMFDKLLFLLTPLKIAISYKVKKNSTKWNSRAERGCRTATSSMRASVHPARRAYCMIGKFSELSYHTIALRGMRTLRLRKMSADADALRRENSTLWNSFSCPLKLHDD